MKKDKCDWSHFSGSSNACARAYIASAIPRQRFVIVRRQGGSRCRADLSDPGALLAFTADMRGVNIAVDLNGHALWPKDIMATAARRRQGHSPVRRRPSSNSRRKRSPATPNKKECKQAWKAQNGHISIISRTRSRLQRKGSASGPFLIYCNRQRAGRPEQG